MLVQQCLVGDKELVEVGSEPGDHPSGIADLDGVASTNGECECCSKSRISLHVSKDVATDGLPPTLEVIGI